ncbi:MAG: hypothetical protein ACOY58_02235 [Candidatus Micrarchaeota archaeon]
MRRLLSLFVLLLALSQLAFAMVVVNSYDGRDVVSGIYYAAVQGDEVIFLTPSSGDSVYGRIGTGKDILLIQSLDHPMLTGMAGNLEQRGNTVDVLVSDDPLETNLELASRSGADGFVLVDPVYGDNTVSALAYAKLNGLYLILADKDNAESVVSELRTQNPERILLYGYTDAELKSGLQGTGLSFEEINTGDKFDDNLELVKRFLSQNPAKKQAILADGSVFESTIASGDDPVILISPLIPSAVRDYIEQQALSGQLPVLLIVDETYTQTAYDLKESINEDAGRKAVTVFVKMGEGTSGAGSDINPVEMFPLPVPTVGLQIEKAEYNQDSGELEITYKNTGNALEYVESRILVYVDGAYAATLGDEEPFPVEREGKAGMAYQLEVEEGQITANITAYFGSSKKSRESGIRVMMDAGRVDFTDSSSLSIADFTHDRESNDLLVSFANNGSASLYFRPYAVIDMNGTRTTIKDDNTYTLGSSEGHIVKFPGIVKSGAVITAGADYGEREAFMDNKVEREYVPEPQGGMDMLLILAVVGVLVVLALLAWTRLRK